MKRRTFVAATTSLIVAPWINRASAQQPVTINVMAYTGLFQDRYTAAVVEPFMRANPGIRVNYSPLPNSAAMIGQLRAQRAAPQVDVVILDVTVAKVGTDEGIFSRLEAAAIPEINELYPNARFPNVGGVAVTFDNLVMIYNTDAVKPPPTSLLDMATPGMRGRVAIPGLPDIQGMSLVMILDKLNGGPGVEGRFAKGIEAMAPIAPNVQTWEPRPDVYAPIINGQAAIGIGWNARAQVNADTSNGKLAALIPKEGTVFQINVINQVQGAPQAQAAQRFISYALSAPAQKAFTESMFYAPTNAKAQIAPSAIDRTAVKFLDRVVPVDWIAVAGVRDQIMDQWRRRVIPLSR